MATDMNQHDLRLQRLREYGHKVTNARLAVLHVLEANQGHMTSAEVLAAVNDYDSSIGRASVFRTLDLFTQLAIIRPTYIDSSMTPNYVLMPDGHHHHIICTDCNRVIEFEDCGLGELARNLEKQYNVSLTGHLLEFYGVCAQCSATDGDEQ